MCTSDRLIKSALTLHLDGRLAEAESQYRQLLEANPRHPLALSMLGTILMDGSGKDEAEALFLRHLDVDPDNSLTLQSLGRLAQDKGKDRDAISLFRRAAVGKPNFAPILCDLASSLHRLGYWDEALSYLDRALKVDPSFGAAHDYRGLVLDNCCRFGEAAEAHLAALSLTSADAKAKRISILLHLSKAAIGAAELEVAEHACRTVLEMDGSNTDALDYLANILYRLHRNDEAIDLLNRLAKVEGLIRKGELEHPEATILVLGGVGAGHVPTRYLFDPALFSTLMLTMISPDRPDAPLGEVAYESLAVADVIFNALGEVERDGGQIEPFKKLTARLGKPILNPPDLVARTGRDRVHELFGDIPGLLLPSVRWMSRDELLVADSFPKPFLIRPGGVHGGEDLALIRISSDLQEYLMRVSHDRFLMIDFYDFKDSRNCYRKHRFIFVDREPFPYHLAIGDNWLVHYWRAGMARDDWKKREEEEFLTDWRSAIGLKAAAIVEEVALRMNLDYCGLDCSVLANGEVLFFEANACMLVHLDDAESEFPYKHIAVPRIRDAITRMVRDRMVQY